MALTAFFNASRRASDGAKSTSSNRNRFRTSSSTNRAERRSGRRVSDPLEAQMRQKRAHIRRQLRQVFVYPLVYICMWLFPFVALCLTYNSKLVRRPPFIVNTLNNFCLCFIGAVNAIVFSLREKPWRHIEGNPSRCFWSSFCLRRSKDGDLEEGDGDSRRPSQRWSGSTCVDANTTTMTMAADYRTAVSTPQHTSQLARPSAVPPPPPPPSLVPPSRESIVMAENEDEDAITPISPPSPSGLAPPRRSTFTAAGSIARPPLTSRCSSLTPPRPPLLRHASTPPLPTTPSPSSPHPHPHPHTPSDFPPGPHTANTLTALSLATAARRSIKRASIMMAASATAPRESDAQRAAKEMAYERLAWERREQHHAAAAAASAARLGAATAAAAGGVQSRGSVGGPRRGSTGEIVGGDAGGGGGGDGIFNAGPGDGAGATAGGGVGAREWWEGRGTGWSGNGGNDKGSGESPEEDGEGMSP
ncbi:G protein-coupled receptor GPR1 [Diplodia seriata]|uniref:G protein-coupled receptor GPR1 n=1 Tax=Diplodia seriata TaxID=420778 RepID=A0A1S8BFY6_9PEZI|nr:G protein-coupled receptor GPR1 [Diplodia seriata]